MTLQKLIIDTAVKYVGQREISGNKGFVNQDFEQRMKTCGWRQGEAWCSYFAELVWKEAYQQFNPAIWSRIEHLFNGSAAATRGNFSQNSELGHHWTKQPVPGSLMIMITGGSWTGHVGIVIAVEGDKVYTIEGNTNASGGREGIEVAKKVRRLDLVPQKGVLKISGFVSPIETL